MGPPVVSLFTPILAQGNKQPANRTNFPAALRGAMIYHTLPLEAGKVQFIRTQAHHTTHTYTHHTAPHTHIDSNLHK